MISRGVVIDTNIAIDLMNDIEEITAKFPKPLRLFLPVIVLGELMYGAEYSARVAENKALTLALKDFCTVLDITEETAATYGAIKADLRRRGSLIPDNNIWIAAIAITNGLTLYTRDKHFSQINGLTLLGD